MIFFYTTCANKKEAQKIAVALVEKKIAVCANFWPIDSVYYWQGKVEKSREAALLIKALEKNFSKVERLIKKMHSYEVPLIANWKSAKVNKEYLSWARGKH